MKSLVSFYCICWVTFAQCQNIIENSNNTFDDFVVCIKEWMKEIESSIKYYFRFENKMHNNPIKEFDNVKQKGHPPTSVTLTPNASNALLNVKHTNYDSNNRDIKFASESDNNNITISNKSNNQSDETKTSNIVCTEKNERYPIPGSCDTYIKCQQGKAEEKQCPNGLRYNHNAKSTVEPCQYPADVKCAPGSTLQPPKPNEVCPNQFGYFKTMDRYNCSSFRICENGVGFDFVCPDGLAFNKITYRCDWPDKVPECDAEALVGYRCPDVSYRRDLNVSRSYRSPDDCRIYFTCVNRIPRRLECTEYFAFDEIVQTCGPAFLVEQCSEKQKVMALRFVRKNINGEYVIRNADEEYVNTRFEELSFTQPMKKRPKII